MRRTGDNNQYDIIIMGYSLRIILLELRIVLDSLRRLRERSDLMVRLRDGTCVLERHDEFLSFTYKRLRG